jgi:hypothetical protein
MAAILKLGATSSITNSNTTPTFPTNGDNNGDQSDDVNEVVGENGLAEVRNPFEGVRFVLEGKLSREYESSLSRRGAV